ncbi:hypothetical protein [Glaciecola petra]|uniref:Uncharacterized protein n=1 Tax=Glaciecola petra TaxID=3075602 RepID=A0ABU2ZUF2_9ALTE|nr:hypothetical protein [Aestuariibacter sp. P117]MDT0596031.1 hypothetical protein [Aestuariibacter sp. P117]
MKFIDDKLNQLRQETADLAIKCHDIGDDKTHQLMLEVLELLEVTHDTFLGKSLTNVSNNVLKDNQKH